MRDYATKADNVDALSASEFNSYIQESENAVTNSDITLDPSGSDANLEMLSEAITRASQGGQSYIDSGAADAYVLTAIGAYKQPSEYVDGMTVLFQAGNTNTGASTINVSSIGVADLKDSSGSDLSAGDVELGNYYLAQYNLANTEFRIILSQSVSTPSLGIGQTITDVTASRSSGVTYTNTTGQPIFVFIQRGSGGTDTNLLVDGVNHIGPTIAGQTTISLVIPDGSTYSYATPVAPSKWIELR